jgi:hypothetical protein
VIELSANEPVAVTEMAAAAPSRQLPEFAANFRPEPGRSFAKTISRDAPPGEDGAPRYWVQPKDLGGLFPGQEAPPAPFIMEAPRGCGPAKQMHEPPTQLLTPAERREALVFDKCHQRARGTLRAAASEACQLTLQMRNRFPHGVMGVEGPGCADSRIYADTRDARAAHHAKKESASLGRRDNIASKRDSQLDYRLATYDPTNSAKETLFQHKQGSSLGLRGEATGPVLASSYGMRPVGHNVQSVAFRSNQEKALSDNPRAGRTANLHSRSTGGKPYDIISGVALPIRPTASFAEMERDRRAHPSNFMLPHRGGTAPTLVGPVPDSHSTRWQPPSPTRSPSKQFMR